MVVICSFFGKNVKAVFWILVYLSFIFILLSNSWYVLCDECNSNNIVFFICDMEDLLNWFIEKFILLHCFSGNKEKLNFSIIC